jgi:hypothetical protein
LDSGSYTEASAMPTHTPKLVVTEKSMNMIKFFRRSSCASRMHVAKPALVVSYCLLGGGGEVCGKGEWFRAL